MSAPVGSKSSLDKVNIVSNDKEHGNSMDIDLDHYQEQHAGRLVLDPEYVGTFHIFPCHIHILFVLS